jgi:hypothetical protein
LNHSVKGSVKIELSGSLLPPAASADGASGCFTYDPDLLLDQAPDQTAAPIPAIRQALTTGSPELCVTATGKAGASFALDTCSVTIKFGSRSQACQSCEPCGTDKTGFELDCNNVDFAKLLDPNIAEEYKLPAFGCFGI